MTEFSVTQWLPKNGSKVMCFGHKTCCCKEDMDENPDWHEVKFDLSVFSYKLKNEIPSDPEESILDSYEVCEFWKVETNDQPEHVIGVTKWKYLEE